jgi:hypothetical protein
MFSMYRQSCALNSLLKNSGNNTDPRAIKATIALVMQAVDAFHSTHSNWMDECQIVFHQLSMKSRQFAGEFPLLTFLLSLTLSQAS